MTRETLATTREDSDSKLMTRDSTRNSAPGKSNDSTRDSARVTRDSARDSTVMTRAQLCLLVSSETAGHRIWRSRRSWKKQLLHRDCVLPLIIDRLLPVASATLLFQLT